MKKQILFLSLSLLCAGIASAQSGISPVSKNWSKYTRSILNKQSAQQKGTATLQRLSSYAAYAYDGSVLELSDSSQYTYSGMRGSKFNFTDLSYYDYEGFTDVLFDSMANYSKNGPDFGLTHGAKSAYDAGNVRHLFTQLTSLPPGSPLSNNYEYRYAYNGDGTMNVKYEFEWKGTAWDSVYRTDYTYNSGKLVEEISLKKNSTWVNDYKATYSYDGANLSEVVNSRWNGVMWEDEDKSILSYDGNNKLIVSLTQEFDGSDWVNQYKDSFAYNGTDFYTYDLSQEWNVDSNDWLNSSIEVRKLNTGGLPDSVFISGWDSMKWIPYITTRFTYNSNNLPIAMDGYFNFNGTPIEVVAYKYYYETFFDLGIADTKTIAADVYPNPAKDVVTIAWKEKPEGNINITLTNLTGQVLWQRSMQPESTSTIAVNDVSPGNYWLTATNAKGERILQKQIVKQ